MKKILVPVIVLAAVFAALVFLKNAVAGAAIAGGVSAVTGLKASVGAAELGILTTRLGIRNFRLQNPKGWPEKEMLNAPELYVDYALGDVLRGDIHIEEMRLNVAELAVVKNARGEVNVDQIKPVRAAKERKTEARPEPSEPAERRAEAKRQGMPPIRIDLLRLTVGKVVYKDYSAGGEPAVQEFDVNLNEEYRDISDPAELVSVVLMRALAKTTISRLAGLDLKALQSGDWSSAVESIGGQAQGLLKGLLGS